MKLASQPTGTIASLERTASLESAATLETVFAPVRSLTAFEETVDRLGTAIRLGLLPPGTRLPAERELCTQLGIARSTLRQALTALSQSGHLRATRGRGGGTFVSDVLPPAAPSPHALDAWRETCDLRTSVEVGIAALAARRAQEPALQTLHELVEALERLLENFPVYRQMDVRLHICLAEATDNPRLVGAMTEVQGAMTDLISLIAHPPEVLASSNAQHRRILKAIEQHDEAAAAAAMLEHLSGTEHILAGLLPSA